MFVSHFGHFLWFGQKTILGRFRDAVLPDFSRFPAGSDDYLNVTPVIGDITVDMSQGVKIYVCVYYLVEKRMQVTFRMSASDVAIVVGKSEFYPYIHLLKNTFNASTNYLFSFCLCV